MASKKNIFKEQMQTYFTNKMFNDFFVPKWNQKKKTTSRDIVHFAS